MIDKIFKMLTLLIPLPQFCIIALKRHFLLHFDIRNDEHLQGFAALYSWVVVTFQNGPFYMLFFSYATAT